MKRRIRKRRSSTRQRAKRERKYHPNRGRERRKSRGQRAHIRWRRSGAERAQYFFERLAQQAERAAEREAHVVMAGVETLLQRGFLAGGDPSR
jgi:hypothetical protein